MIVIHYCTRYPRGGNLNVRSERTAANRISIHAIRRRRPRIFGCAGGEWRGIVARVQTRGVTTRSKNRFGGEPSSKRALQLESPPLHARIYEKLYGHFPPRYPPFRPRKTMKERESFSSLFLPLPPSFIVSRLPRALLAFYPSGREREGGRLIQVEALGEIEPADQIL